MIVELKLKAEKRSETGKGPARRIREVGEVPGVLYGLGSEPNPVKVKKEDIFNIIQGESGRNVLIDLTVVDGKEKENHLVIIKEIQKHPFKEKLLHVDFLKVARDEKITAKVPIVITGEDESVGLKAGGTLQHTLWELEVECLPAEIPDSYTADVRDLEIGDNLKVEDLSDKPGVDVQTDPQDTVLTILAPRLEEEEEEEVEELLVEEELAEEEVAPVEERPEEEEGGEEES